MVNGYGLGLWFRTMVLGLWAELSVSRKRFNVPLEYVLSAPLQM